MDKNYKAGLGMTALLSAGIIGATLLSKSEPPKPFPMHQEEVVTGYLDGGPDPLWKAHTKRVTLPDGGQ